MKISASKPLLSTLKPGFRPLAPLPQTGQALGTPLCQSLEQSLGGGLRSECATALIHQEVGLDAQGRGFLKA